MNRPRLQTGATLVVSLIMLVVLTLLAVSAIRFGIINLKISGNVQAETEATAAAQVAIEAQIEDEIKVVENIDAILAKSNIPISTGGATYQVNLAKPACKFSVPVLNQDLNPANPNDVPCFEGADQDAPICPDGKPCPKLSACNRQQWDLAATVIDPSSGAQVNLVQGIAVRVQAGVSCN